MNKWRIEIDTDGKCRRVGLDTGPTTLVAINDEEKLLVLKIAGHKYWSNRMEGDKYAPAAYQVHRFEEISRGPKKLVVEVEEIFGLMDFPLRPGPIQWKFDTARSRRVES